VRSQILAIQIGHPGSVLRGTRERHGQIVDTHRLAQIVIPPGGQTFFAVTFHGAHRQSNDVGVQFCMSIYQRLTFLNHFSDFVTAYYGHVTID
jgi:hypothetical protein